MGIVVVYDVSEEKSFNSLQFQLMLDVQEWLQTVTQQADPNVRLILVGNKCDAKHERVWRISI